MKILVIEPDAYPYTHEIDGGLESMQAVVEGYIEPFYFTEEPVAIICNEEHKLYGLPLHRAIRNEDGEVMEALGGTFFIVGVGEEDFISLTDEQIVKYSEQFKYPETIFMMGDKVYAVPKRLPKPPPDISLPHKAPGGDAR